MSVVSGFVVVVALVVSGLVVGVAGPTLIRWTFRSRCPGCQHTREAPVCFCQRQDCVCRAGRRQRFDAAVGALSPRDQRWLDDNRARFVALLEAAAVDLDHRQQDPRDQNPLSPRSAPTGPADLRDLIAAVDMAELRRLLDYQIAEADNPAAMLEFLTALIPPR